MALILSPPTTAPTASPSAAAWPGRWPVRARVGGVGDGKEFIRLFWYTHRLLYRLTGGRLGLWRPGPNGWGALRLITVGRRTGHERSVMVGYFEQGSDLVTLAMNGWKEGEPAWWLNLQAQPDVRVDLADGPRLVTGRPASGEERERLWSRWREIDKNLDG